MACQLPRDNSTSGKNDRSETALSFAEENKAVAKLLKDFPPVPGK
jgi:hypothetical protein